MSSGKLFLLWIPLVVLLLMVIWGFIGWYGLGIDNAGVLGDAMSPITSLITAFTLGIAFYSLDSQRKVLKDQEDRIERDQERQENAKRFDILIERLEQLDAEHHTSTKCPYCEILGKTK